MRLAPPTPLKKHKMLISVADICSTGAPMAPALLHQLLVRPMAMQHPPPSNETSLHGGNLDARSRRLV